MPRKITPEFKRECAELVITHGNSHKEAAAAMNVGLSSIQGWVAQYRQELSGVTPKVTALTPEQLKQLQSDNELLKKASAFFAIEMNKNKQLR